MQSLISGFSSLTDSVIQNLPNILPAIVSTAVKAGSQDPRIGKIVGGMGLIGSGVCLITASRVPKSLKSWLWNRTNSSYSVREAYAKTALQWGCAGVGIVATSYGIYNVAIGLMEIIYPSMSDEDLYLVCHDNKPKHDQKAGHILPRLGIVNSRNGEYTAIEVNKSNPLAQSKDLESLTWVKDNEYLVCESQGRCFHIGIEEGEEGYSASVIKQFMLPVPEGRFYNIEAVAIRDQGAKVCWSHRGGIYAGEEPWKRCGPIDLESGIVPSFSEEEVEDPFGILNKLNRAISDHAVGPKTGADYFMATIDTEGSEGIAATEDVAYSILYTNGQCLELFPGEMAEALSVSPDESTFTFATDNEAAGSKICQYDLNKNSLHCSKIREGEEYGIGGIAPLRT
ncbi:MAG: hypothetical protein KR126chlam3_00755 [Chlamydiae bacterium]|nr:hypothetical protein [Chlamydiota bacterium]